MSVGSRLFQVRRGEGQVVGLVVACMFVSVAGMTIGESGISALFFDRIGPGSLPVMYLAQGAVGIAAMLLLSGLLGRLEPSRAYVVLPIVLLAIVGLERVILAGGPRWIYPALYLTVALAMLVQSVYLWGVAGLVTDARRAKRLFPLFGAGNILGSVVGGLLTKPLAHAVGAENLLVVWAATLLAAALLCATIVRIPGRPVGRRRRRRSAIGEIAEGFRSVRRSPLLVWMSIGSVLFSVLFFSFYLPFAQAATARYPGPDALAGFFGIFWAAVTATAFFVAILLTNRLLGWFGAAAMIVVLPVLYMGAFSILLVTSTFATLVAIRFGVNVWLQGVASPSWETLTNVTAAERRDQTRAFLNGGPSQIGTAIAGVIALVGQDVLTARQLAMIGIVAAVGTVVVTWMIRRSYAGALIDVIRAGRPSVFDEPVRGAPIAIDRDAQTISLALESLGADEARIRRLAIHVLATSTEDDERVRVALVAAAGDADPGVRASAVDALGQLSWLAPDLAQTALVDADPLVRRAAVMHMADPTGLMNASRDPDPSVAAAAAARLLGGDAVLDARAVLEGLLAGPTEARLATLSALATAPATAEAAELALPYASDPSPLVRAAAFDVLAGAAPAVAVPPAIGALRSGDALTVHAALRVIDEVGLEGFDGTLDRVVEEHRDRAVADGRLASLVATTDDAERLLHDALGSLARAEAIVVFSAVCVTAANREGMRTAVDALRSGDPREIANALEVIEVAGSSETVRPLVASWESRESGRAVTDPAALATARVHPDPFIRACADLVGADYMQGGGTMTSTRYLSTMEMVLLLRPVELFAALEPVDLERVAAIAEERTFADGAVIAEEGEMGDELYVVLEGNVQVTRADGSMVARRGPGDVIGELSLLRQSPRMASLIAEGDVRTIGIQQPAFEGMIRDRPEIALAIMRMLAERLTAASEPVEVAG